MKLFGEIGAFFLAAFFLTGCPGEVDVDAIHHYVTILSVTPSSATAGQPASFDVLVSYKLGSLYAAGVIDVGFNDEYPDCYRIADQQAVSSGTGTINFLGLRAIPTDWGTAGTFSAAAILNANNLQKASAIQVISLTTGTL